MNRNCNENAKPSRNIKIEQHLHQLQCNFIQIKLAHVGYNKLKNVEN